MPRGKRGEKRTSRRTTKALSAGERGKGQGKKKEAAEEECQVIEGGRKKGEKFFCRLKATEENGRLQQASKEGGGGEALLTYEWVAGRKNGSAVIKRRVKIQEGNKIDLSLVAHGRRERKSKFTVSSLA